MINPRINIPGEYVDTQSVGDDGQEPKDGHGYALHPKAALLNDLELVFIEVSACFLYGGRKVVARRDVTGDDFGKVHFFGETT